MKKIKPVNPPPPYENQHLKSSINFALKVLTAASVISCLTLPQFQANAEDFNTPFKYYDDTKAIPDEAISFYEVTKYELKNDEEYKIVEEIRQYLAYDKKYKFVAPMASAAGKEFYPKEHQFYNGDFFSVEYSRRDASSSDVINKNLIFDNVLSEHGREHYVVIGTDGTNSLNKESDVKAKDGDKNFNHFWIKNNSRTTSRDNSEGNAKVMEGVALHINKNYEGGAITNAIFENNKGVLTITEEEYKKGYTGGNVRGAAMFIENAKDKAAISKIEADFIGNSVAISPDSYHYEDYHADGGAIYITHESVIKEGIINSYFEDNSAQRGGAIFNNKSTIGSISALFKDNKATGAKSINGGAIYNETDNDKKGERGIGDIKSYFIGNSATATGGAANGGAIFNAAHMGNIEGIFAENKVAGTELSLGGAIYNRLTHSDGHIRGYIGNINSYFVKNEAHQGGAIANQGEIAGITGYFEGNVANDKVRTPVYESSYGPELEPKAYDESNSEGGLNVAYGGAIYNYAFSEEGDQTITGKIGDIKASFYNNKISINESKSSSYYYLDGGGAIANVGGQIGDITGDFVGNKIERHSHDKGYYTYGGAIYNVAVPSVKDGDENKPLGGIIGSNAISGAGTHGGIYDSNFYDNEAEHGSAIYNGKKAKIGVIENTNFFENKGGSTVYNEGTIGNITANFGGNDGWALLNEGSDAQLGNIEGFFVENYSGIYNYNGEIKNITAEFYNNRGTALENSYGQIGNITGDFVENGQYSSNGGAIYNYSGKIGNIEGTFYKNHANTYGGAVYNTGTMGTFKNTSFIENRAGSQGGAIYTTKDITIEADDEEVVFSGNTAGGRQEAIYVADKDANVTMSAKGSGSYYIDDQINGVYDKDSEKGYGLKFKGSGSSKLVLNNKISNADIEYSGFTADITSTNYLNDNNSLTMKSGEINFGELGSDGIHFRKFDFQKGNINIDNVIVDLETQEMGKIYADDYGEVGSGSLTLKGLKVTSDSPNEKTPVFFADSSFANGVSIDVTEVKGPVFEYAVTYSHDGAFDALMKSGRASGGGNNGYAVFTRTDYNPAVQATSIAQLAGVYSAVMQSFEYSFEHADTFSALPASVRKAKLNDNKYAINEAASLPSYYNELTKKSMWFRPYTTFENVPLKNGPKVSNVVYGSYAGGDSEIIPLKNGWSTVYTGYVGYNGSHQSFDGNSTYQNGVILGATDTLYKDAFYTALTMSVGTSFGETSTSFGNEDFTMLYGGVASKTGYNFEFNDGRFIIQPNLLLAYTFINTFDYTNAAGVKINSEPLHSLQVNPHVKFILNTQSGWQPYLTGGFVYNVMGQSQVKAVEGPNVYSLPAVSIKPYAEYGVGIQKLWDDKYTGFLQAMVRSGGRNGVAFVTGFRWALGDDNKVEKVQKPDKNIKTVSNVTKTEKSKKVKTEKPAKVKVEKPDKVETPAVLKTTEKVENPDKVELEKSAKVKAEKTVKVETKVPEKVQTNEIILKTDVIQTPVKTETSVKVETPAKIKTETLTKTQQPEREEHHSFIYNWMLNFSNFFALPAEKRTAKK